MLCRSASSGVLGSLLPIIAPVQSYASWPENEKSDSPVLHHAYAHVSNTPRSSLQSPVSQHFELNEDSRSIEAGDWDFEGTNVPWPMFRKVQSENDLQAFCRASSCSASLAAADSLLRAPQQEEGNSNGLGHGDNFSGLRSSRRSRRPRLRRQLSLSVIPSRSSDSLVSEVDDSTIPEVMESSVAAATGNEIPSVSGRFLDDSVMMGMQYMGELGQKSGTILKAEELSAFSNHATKPSLLSTVGSTSIAAKVIDDSCGSIPFNAGQSGSERRSWVLAEAGAESTSHFGREGKVNMAMSSTAELPRAEFMERRIYNSQKEGTGPMFITDLGIGNGGGGSGTRGVSGGGSGGGYGDSNGVEAQYRSMLEADPGHPLLLRNYANFLHEVKGEPLRAEPYYERAVLANPGDGEVLGQYAQLIWEVYKDDERAGRYFDQALQACPDDCYLNAAYASFLWSSESDTVEDGDSLDVSCCSVGNMYIDNMPPPMLGTATVSA